MTKARVLVTGATGFVGANLVRRLVDLGYQVHLINRPASNQWRLKDILSRVKIHQADLVEEEKIKRIVKKAKPEIIFHLAAVGAFGGKDSVETEAIKSNFIGTVNLINACSKLDYKCFVNTGSSSEYGPKDKPMQETDICQPINFYGLSKLASTLYGCLIAKRENKPIIGLRLFSPYGPYDDHRRLMSYLITRLIKNEDLELASPNGLRDFIYIEDVVDLYLKAINRAGQYKGEIFNLGRGQQVSVKEVVAKAVKIVKSQSKIKWGFQRPRPWDTKIWQADIKKTKKAFNWQPKHSLEQGLKKTINWFRENLELYQ